MISVQKKYWFVFFILLGVLSLPSTVHGQQKVEYRGTLQVDTYTGDAIYEYKIVQGDTILDGPFQMKRSSLEALLEKEDVSFLFQGAFEDGTPNSAWKFQFGAFQSDSQTKVVDYEYRVLISGIQEEGSGLIKNGKPDGLWTYEVSTIKNSEKEKNLFKSDISFENGVPQRNFQLENEDAILVGRFLRNGLAHDEWSSYDTKAVENVESWIFEEGVLQKIQSIEDGETTEIPIFDTQAEAYETVNLDARYLKVIALAISDNSGKTSLGGNLPRLLATNAAYYQKIDRILSKLGTSDFAANFKVLLPYFAQDSVEVNKARSVSETYKSAQAISGSLLNNSHLNILKRSNDDARYYYNCVAKIQEEYLLPLQPFVELADQNVLKFIRRDQFIKRLWPERPPTTSIKVEIDSLGSEKTFTLPHADSFNFQGDHVESLLQIAQYAKLSLEAIQESLQDQLNTTAEAQKLGALEEHLIQQNQALVAQVDSVNGTLPLAYARALQNIQKLADAALSRYATIKEQKEKLEYGTSLKNCFKELSMLSALVAGLPAEASEIDSLYIDSVWNPFMAVVMDEEVKKRLIAAYDKVLIPYFLKRATDELSCENAGNLNHDIQQTNQRMRALRDEETKKLERKLRREKDPSTILRLLNVQPKHADQ